MITEIPRNKWKEYFSEFSRVMEGWDTKVEVLSCNIGAQTLSTGLPFGGVTFDEKDGQATVDLSLGLDAESHITHNIPQPTKVAFEDGFLEHGGVLDIEAQDGSKTLVTFVQPFPMSVEYERTEIVSFG